MSVNPLNTAVTALRTNQFRLDTTANNVANVNTDGFQARTVQSSDRAYINSIGTGTQVASTYKDTRPGAPVQNSAAVAPDIMGSQAPDNALAPQAPQASQAAPGEMSNSDMAREMTNLQSTRAAYGANTVMGRTADEMTQTLLNIIA